MSFREDFGRIRNGGREEAAYRVTFGPEVLVCAR